MTLNGVIALILRFITEYPTALQADYVTVVEDRPIGPTVRKYIVSQFQFSTFGQKVAHPAARSLCNS